MAHDPLFEQRIAAALKAHAVKAEPKKMFGGVAFMVNGHMSVGITNKGDLMVRFAPDRHAEILQWPGAKPMTHGRPGMKGFLFVEPSTVEQRRSLDRWVALSLEYISSLPKKAAKRSRPEPSGKPAPAKSATKPPTKKNVRKGS